MAEMPVDIARLSFPDIPSGSAYLSRLPLASPAASEQQLLHFLEALLADPPSADTLLSLLEQARVPLCFVEEEMARRYHNKALPLNEEEAASFKLVINAWELMRTAYERCAHMAEPMAGNPEFTGLVATVLHRCIYYAGMVILEHYRARREVPAGAWSDLHRYYAKAEDWGVANTPIEDGLENNLQATHCSAAYVTLLLIDVASPYSNSVRNLNLIRRWAGMWAPLVSVHAINDDLEAPPYIVELSKDAPLHATNTNENIGLDARGLDTSRLGLQISHMLTQLRQRMTPSQLGLGEETGSYVIALLEQLGRPWTQATSPRRFRRFAAVGTTRVATGFEAIHYYVSGAEFVQSDAAATYSRDSFDKLFTFGGSANPNAAPQFREDLNYPIDQWSVINHSANGFRLSRTVAGKQITHSQLLSVCPHDGETFLLAQASWLMEESDGGLLLGLSILPGAPKGIAARPQGLTDGKRPSYMRIFLLPPIPAIEEEASVVLPKNVYQASQVLEINSDNQTFNVRLKHIRQRGSDFDRVSFDIL